MRVVAGSARGRPLVAPPGRETRPTSDRVREAIANALHSLGLIEGAEVLDLFAGSGALGIELLSRGAAHCTFVERDRAACAAIERNLAATGLAARADVVVADALRWLAGGGAGREVDVALLDPPYAFDDWAGLLEALPAHVAVIESDREPALPEGWQTLRSRRYGGTVVVFAARGSEPHPE